MIDHLRIAEAQLRGRPRQSAIALASVAVGTAMLIVTLSLTTGLSEDFLEKTTETSAHVEVLPRLSGGWRPEAIRDDGEDVFALSRHARPDDKRAVRAVSGVLAALRGLPGVKVATPSVDAQVVCSSARCAARQCSQGSCRRWSSRSRRSEGMYSHFSSRIDRVGLQRIVMLKQMTIEMILR